MSENEMEYKLTVADLTAKVDEELESVKAGSSKEFWENLRRIHPTEAINKFLEMKTKKWEEGKINPVAASVLNGAFPWEDSLQGHPYWNLVYRGLIGSAKPTTEEQLDAGWIDREEYEREIADLQAEREAQQKAEMERRNNEMKEHLSKASGVPEEEITDDDLGLEV